VAEAKLKIGRFSYSNLFPIFYGLAHECDCSRYDFVEGVPSELNRKIRQGMIDVSPSSSIEYLRHTGDYDLIRNHSISSRGPVGSIFLFSKKPVGALGGAEVLASSQSETSVALLRIILEKFIGIAPEIRSSSEPFGDAIGHADAYMLIGDDALAEALKWPGLHRYDLGDLWFRNTGLPISFALWISRKACCPAKTGLLDQFRKDLDRAKAFALRNLEAIALASPLKSILTASELVQYWRGISYDFGPEHEEGLALFRKYADELGLL